MIELVNINQEVLNTKDRITLDLLKDGQEFLEKYDINYDLVLDTVSLVYRYLKASSKVPHNLYKFFIAAYYIISRHPMAFPAHQPKKKFCKLFGLESSSLEYSVDRIINTLNYRKILDDKNFPYYFDPSNDLSFKFSKRVVKDKVQKEMMKFYLYNQPINSQLLAEDLVTTLVFEMKSFPEELFRQFYEIILEIVEDELQDYKEYVQLQQRYFV